MVGFDFVLTLDLSFKIYYYFKSSRRGRDVGRDTRFVQRLSAETGQVFGQAKGATGPGQAKHRPSGTAVI